MPSNNGRGGGFFQPASKSERHLKVLLTGTFGTGKTRAALSFPQPIAVLDLEGGTALYSGNFDVLRSKDLRTIEQAIDSLQGSPYKTVVIDPITVIYTLLQDAAQSLVERRNQNQPTIESGKSLTPREWGLIKREYNALLTKLINLPMHVVLVTREKDLYEGTGDNMRKIGVQPDTEKGTPYLADFVLHMLTEGQNGETFVTVVEKSRSPMLPKGKKLVGYGADPRKGLYPLFLAPVADEHQGGAPVQLEDDSAAASKNADVLAREEAPAERVGHQQLSALNTTRDALGWTVEQLQQHSAAKGYPANLRQLSTAQATVLQADLNARLDGQKPATPAAPEPAPVAAGVGLFEEEEEI